MKRGAAMKHGWLAVVVLGALPARGEGTALSDAVVSVLTPLDSVPTPAALDRAFAPDLALDRLQEIALDSSHDLGIQLRAIRALPAYCPPAGCDMNAPVHITLWKLLDRYTPEGDATQQGPLDLLRLQATAEALGATRSGLAEDFERLWQLIDIKGIDPLTTCAPRRDVRATAARAIGRLCFLDAFDALRTYQYDACGQVAVQVQAAMQALGQCPK